MAALFIYVGSGQARAQARASRLPVLPLFSAGQGARRQRPTVA